MIAIKGMEEMPKSCNKCPFKADFPNTGLKNGVCNDLHLPFIRHPYCPLVEIVTCKDCKHYKHHGINGYCSKRVNTDSHTDVYREPDYFCALGERRE